MKNLQLILPWALALAIIGTSCNQRTATTAENETTETGTDTSDSTATAANTSADCQPLETRTANVPEQKPTFKEQNRACGITTSTPLQVTVLAKGLKNPWAVEPLPNGDLLVTEKPGQLRIITADGKMGAPIKGVPKVDARGQGGLLDVALSPNFASDRTIYWSFSEPRGNGNATSVAKGVLSEDRSSLSQVKVIFQAKPAYNGTMHYGSRLAFGPDGMLFVTLGERSDLEIRPQAQHMDSHMGKILRITTDGKPAPENPFLNQQGAMPEIWSVGHRNVQSAAIDEQGRLWAVEHGPQGGDEVNLIEKGKNYGWPLVTFGEEYSGKPVPNSVTTKQGYVDPVYYWDPVIAPAGAQFYSGNLFPEWKGNLFIGSLKDMMLVRLKLENDRVTGEEHLLKDRSQRIRDVRQGPDGALYVVTDQENGELWKITPKQ
ncbi:PQQ-dependent sugar dehydrogenase [Pontibacter sp. Tf4]|uniref:PQQ-dependent sugar dehydrogenase n=1 Tax=Pontibacter sp. Tf4 TaxID=2761620 RepID=UPI0016254AE8|nr:PQQ-dependent sugar dehydrogenase [Pontibacter sp. Tf4]MBB6610608.1 PQQ-dependent sugar dehydrogenase [Pontibacter sp. Tf4]